MTAILDGIRIIDLSTGHSGPVTTQLLAEAGADVVKVEAPDGDPTRSYAAFATWNRSKRGVVLDLQNADDRQQLDALLAGADVVVHGLPPSEAARQGLDDATLRGRYPQLVVCSILGYPINHADAERPGDELLVQARSGMMDEQLGWRDGPIALRFPLGSWAAAYLAAAGIVTRLIVRERTGAGGGVHTSLLQGMLNTVSLVWNRSDNPSPALLSSKYDIPQQIAMYQCSDEVWLQIMNPGERIDIGAIPLTQQVLTELGDPGHPVDADRLRRAFHFRTSDEWLDALREADVAVEPALPLGALLGMAELADNDYVVTVDDPTWGRVLQPAVPFQITPSAVVRSAAPRLGQHGDEVRAEVRTPTAQPTGTDLDAGLTHPLSGVKVLDVGAFLAGPMAPMLLGDLGADVIKVEPLVGDRMRFMSNYFEACSRGKRSIAVDLSQPAGQEVLDRLIRWADIVHHNQRRAASHKLGIDAAAIHERNENAVFGYVSAYGQNGDRADWPGFDSIFQALGGWEVENAGEGNSPLFSRFGSLDVQCALSSLVGTLLTYYRRQRTGIAGSVSGSLVATAAYSASETMLLADGSVAPYPRMNAAQTGYLPGQRLYATTTGWVAIVTRSEAELTDLLKVAEVSHERELEAALKLRSSEELVAALEAAGVPAEIVREGCASSFFDDADHRAAGLVADYEHAAYGRMQQPGAYLHFDDLPLRIERAAPVIGAHTREILDELGYSEPQIQALYDDRVVGSPGGAV
jgi:crotonobetainyl-CoA:carnitine CoA-transferase CaiB-like acyl-CoA transferase